MDDHLIERLYESDPTVSHFTADKLQKILLAVQPLTPVKSASWIASAVRWAVHSALRASRFPEKGPAAIRDELATLAAQAENLADGLKNLSDEARDELWHAGFRRWPGESADVESLYGDSKEIGDLEKVRQLLGPLAEFMNDAARELDDTVQSRKRLSPARKRRRTYLAAYLAPVFEASFATDATYRNAGSNNDPASLGPWADFYCRVLAQFGINDASTNLAQVLRDARSLQNQGLVLFDPKTPSE